MELPVEVILSAIGGLVSAISYLALRYIADLKETNEFLRGQIGSAQVAQTDAIRELSRNVDLKMELMLTRMDFERGHSRRSNPEERASS
jgi:hypothetical protein